MIMRKRFYVYLLTYPDGTPFYVGKGQNNRISTHTYEARRGCECPKCVIIRSIWAEGDDIGRSIVRETNDEKEALLYERELIAHYGLEHLTNRNEGGSGIGSHRFTPQQISSRQVGRRAYYVTAKLPSLLKQIGYTIPPFCKACGITPQTLYRAMQRRSGVFPTNAWRIAATYAHLAGIDEETSYRTIIEEA
jgi:hypothetical protein